MGHRTERGGPATHADSRVPSAEKASERTLSLCSCAARTRFTDPGAYWWLRDGVQRGGGGGRGRVERRPNGGIGSGGPVHRKFASQLEFSRDEADGDDVM